MLIDIINKTGEVNNTPKKEKNKSKNLIIY